MSIKVNIGGSVAGLKAALDKGQGLVKNWGRSIKSSLGSVRGMLASAGIVYGFKQIVDDLDNMSKRARGLGVTVEELQKLEYAAKSANVPVTNLMESVPKAAKLAADALGGNAGAVAKLAALGISIEEIRGANPYRVFELIARGVSQIEDPAQRIAAVMNALGEVMSKNVQFFTDFAQNAQNLAASGRLIKDEDALAAEKINQSLTDAATAIRAIIVNSGGFALLSDLLEHKMGDIAVQRAIDAGEIKPHITQEEVARTEALTELVTDPGLPGWQPKIPTKMPKPDQQNRAYTADALPLEEKKHPLVEQALKDMAELDRLEAEERERLKNDLDAIDKMAAAVQTVAAAAKTTAGSAAGSLGDPTQSDALRRMGGSLGGLYDRRAENIARATKEAAEATAATLEQINRNGLTLRG